ncbi:hypothetical protein RF11_00819 [Thelohanellus kitauei]|uniref:Uncharacterized protein n=1 Tax=Thelohanellus kitauei TaxID=669202 RepID=A0A0C2MZ16_THEKT|nr:hypothetical protein RF11_00819 [Thelohanellus kitauei]
MVTQDHSYDFRFFFSPRLEFGKYVIQNGLIYFSVFIKRVPSIQFVHVPILGAQNVNDSTLNGYTQNLNFMSPEALGDYGGTFKNLFAVMLGTSIRNNLLSHVGSTPPRTKYTLVDVNHHSLSPNCTIHEI